MLADRIDRFGDWNLQQRQLYYAACGVNLLQLRYYHDFNADMFFEFNTALPRVGILFVTKGRLVEADGYTNVYCMNKKA